MMVTEAASLMIRKMGINDRVLKRQMEGLTNEDLLLQPDMRGNCANWVLGHIVVSRNNMLKRLGEETVWGEAEEAIYARESQAITGPDSPHLPMDQLLEAHAKIGACVVACLETITNERLAENINEDTTLLYSLDFSVWHESYHTGQFEYLRQLSGVADKVI